VIRAAVASQAVLRLNAAGSRLVSPFQMQIVRIKAGHALQRLAVVD